MTAGRDTLPPDVEILDGTGDVESLWDRFEVFEALHHSLAICNPLTSDQLDEVIDATSVPDGGEVLDVACGSGEVLFRMARRGAIDGHGVDLSPWMIAAAHRRGARAASELATGSRLRWTLGDAKQFRPDTRPNVCVCVGAEWVWHDFRGTARALGGLLDHGGVAVIGAARLHHCADRAEVAASHGTVETVEDMAAALRSVGLEPRHRVDPDDAGWDAYLSATRTAAHEWQALNPGPRSDRWVVEQEDWWSARQRDREIIGWSVWVAQKIGSNE